MSLFNPLEPSFGGPQSNSPTATWLKQMMGSDSHPNRAIFAMLGSDSSKKDVNSYYFDTKEEAETFKKTLKDYFYPILELDLNEMGLAITHAQHWKTQWPKGKQDFAKLLDDPRVGTYQVIDDPKYPDSVFLVINESPEHVDTPFPFDELYNMITIKDKPKREVLGGKIFGMQFKDRRPPRHWYGMGPAFISASLKDLLPGPVQEMIKDPKATQERIENFKKTYPWLFPTYTPTTLPADPFAGEPFSREMGAPATAAYAQAMMSRACQLKSQIKAASPLHDGAAAAKLRRIKPAVTAAVKAGNMGDIKAIDAFMTALAAEESALNPAAKSKVDPDGTFAFGYWQLRTSNRKNLARAYKLPPLVDNANNPQLQGQYAGHLMAQVVATIKRKFKISPNGKITPLTATGTDSAAAWNAGWKKMFEDETKGSASYTASLLWLMAAKWGVGFMQDTPRNLKKGAEFSKARHAIILAASALHTLKYHHI